MVLCFHCSQETKQLMDGLLQAGSYKDYAEVIATAVANLSMLQAEVTRNGAIIIGDNYQEPAAPFATPSPAPPAAPTADASIRTPKPARKPAKPPVKGQEPVSAQCEIPEHLRLDGLGKPAKAAAAPIPDDVWVPGAVVPLDRWVFGQCNKLLPAKVSCRALAHLLMGEHRGALLDDAAMQIAADARELGRLLRAYDEQYRTDRDTALAVAFPSADEDKSLTRYANQFVANVNKFGQVSGLLVDLKLVNYVKAKDVRLLLTEVGWELAMLRNPVLDTFPPPSTDKFSDEEIAFLLGHIRRSVPAEDFAYRAIIKGVAGGASSPEQIDACLEQFVTPARKEALSKSFLSSQRSGAVSRMVDLGLLQRARDGVKVSYVVTERGQEYDAAKALGKE